LKQNQSLEERMAEKSRLTLRPSELSQLHGQESSQAGQQQHASSSNEGPTNVANSNKNVMAASDEKAAGDQ